VSDGDRPDGVCYESDDGYDYIEGDVGGPPQIEAEASPFGGPRHPDPGALVIFGITGDLAYRKLIPALYDLACHQVLPEQTTVVGYGRKPLDDGALRDLMQRAIDDHYGADAVDGKYCERVLRAPRYVQGEFDDAEGYRRLAAVLDELGRGKYAARNRMFYLATPPSLFPVIARALGSAGLARWGAGDVSHTGGEPVAGWSRLVVEKPFGRDLETARELDGIIRGVFDEAQVYRIDHYLAKETVQNLLVLRFANAIFEPVWNRRHVDHVQITAAETLGIEHRGPYYEEAGALRDMLEPHLLQLFALVAMEPPVAFGADAVRDEKLKVLRCVRPIPRERVDLFAARGQYVEGVVDGALVPGYRQEERVPPDSQTETFAAVKLLIDNWRWQGVPFYLRTGKRMARQVTEIAIQFRRPPVALFGAGRGAPQANVLVLRVQPDEGFSLLIESKQPGQELSLTPVDMDFTYGGTLQELPFSAYETVLVDAMEGDQTLFNRDDQVEGAWRIVAPILEAWAVPLPRGVPIYESGTWGPEAADTLVARDGHAWRRPRGVSARPDDGLTRET
jgi:glucose-6-phosphate 1-dehydrogenase